MVQSVTKGIHVSVETEYQPEYSSPVQFHFVFTYRVTIQNKGDQTIQLQRRRWFIHDAANPVKEVEGEGVIGQQPILEPGQMHTYVSGCNLKSPFGKMHGYYTMERMIDGQKLNVQIPEFNMVAPYKLN